MNITIPATEAVTYSIPDPIVWIFTLYWVGSIVTLPLTMQFIPLCEDGWIAGLINPIIWPFFVVIWVIDMFDRKKKFKK